MQNIIFVNGSPRKSGNTSFLLSKVEEGIVDQNVSIDNIHLYDKEIQPCIDCRACKKGNLVCTIKDDMQTIYEKLENADLMVIGTPIYWFGPTAKTKLMLDRFRPYFGNKKLMGKKAVLVLPAGTGEKDCDLTIEMFKRSFNALGIELIDSVTSKAYDMGDSKNDNTAISSITRLSAKLNSLN
jgi:multimeric flavodoxin WrbA